MVRGQKDKGEGRKEEERVCRHTHLPEYHGP